MAVKYNDMLSSMHSKNMPGNWTLISYWQYMLAFSSWPNFTRMLSELYNNILIGRKRAVMMNICLFRYIPHR